MPASHTELVSGDDEVVDMGSTCHNVPTHGESGHGTMGAVGAASHYDLSTWVKGSGASIWPWSRWVLDLRIQTRPGLNFLSKLRCGGLEPQTILDPNSQTNYPPTSLATRHSGLISKALRRENSARQNFTSSSLRNSRLRVHVSSASTLRRVADDVINWLF